MSDQKVDTSTWNNSVRGVVTGLEKLVPKIGGVLNFMTSLFWPKTRKSIWELIEDQVYVAIQKEILKKELEVRKAQLQALQHAVDEYQPGKGNRENTGALMIALDKAASLKIGLAASSNRIHLMPLSIVVAHIYLALLRERLTHALEVYEVTGDKRVSSVGLWYDEIKREHADYKAYFEKVHAEWVTWRRGLLVLSPYKKERCTLEDKLQGRVVNIAQGDAKISPLGQDMADRIFNAGHAEVADFLSLTFVLNRYLPDPARFVLGSDEASLARLGYGRQDPESPLASMDRVARPIAVLARISIGPISRYTEFRDQREAYKTQQVVKADAPGVITGFRYLVSTLSTDTKGGREVNAITWALYGARQGIPMGDPVSGTGLIVSPVATVQLPTATPGQAAPYYIGIITAGSRIEGGLDYLYADGPDMKRTNLYESQPGAKPKNMAHAGPSYRMVGVQTAQYEPTPSVLMNGLLDIAVKVTLVYEEPPL